MMSKCPKCGKLFVRANRPICDLCFKKDEETYEITRQYLKENPSATMEVLVEETGATKKQILRWIREGRLEIEGETGVKCAKCGVPIKQGRICDKCATKLQSGLQSTVQQVEEPKKKSNVIKVTNRR